MKLLLCHKLLSGVQAQFEAVDVADEEFGKADVGIEDDESETLSDIDDDEV